MALILREKYLEKIRPFYDSDDVKVLAGIGRCGKSLLLRSIAEELRERGIPPANMLFIDFSRPESASFAYAEGLYQKIRTFARESRGKLYLFFDAFDRVDDGEKALALIRADVDSDIYLSVSERAVSVEQSLVFSVYPFGFDEFLACYRENVSPEALDAIFRAFLRTGGMPYVFSLGLDPERVRLYLSDTIKILFVAEIAKRYEIRNIDLLERVAQ